MTKKDKDDLMQAFRVVLKTYSSLSEDQVWNVLNSFESEDAIPMSFLEDEIEGQKDAGRTGCSEYLQDVIDRYLALSKSAKTGVSVVMDDETGASI